MELKDYLTNEKVRKKFSSQFDLVNYAIKLAANMIMSGRDSRVKIDSQNRAMQVLSEILNDKDQFDEIIIHVEENNHLGTYKSQGRQEERRQNRDEDSMDDVTSKPKERKKNRKILIDG